MKRPRPHVTDHAMLRYLERVVGIDVTAHRRDIERLVAQAVELQATALTKDGYRYVINDFRVTTVMPAHSELRIMRPFRHRDGWGDG
ncbi:hypothetical protein [Halodurantibacterium flavum]|uniref:Uncharacterized protein n=1 Tax=Halodurantibacterium flavum TaxID=1382802 RepID=A0ABW4SBH7_9RHOB